MLFVLAVLVSALGGGFIGWRLHLFWCEHRTGCPLWLMDNAQTWKPQEELSRWRWSKRNKHRGQKGPGERHPTPQPAVDSDPASGVPFTRRDTPEALTRPANPKRRTTP